MGIFLEQSPSWQTLVRGGRKEEGGGLYDVTWHEGGCEREVLRIVMGREGGLLEVLIHELRIRRRQRWRRQPGARRTGVVGVMYEWVKKHQVVSLQVWWWNAWIRGRETSIQSYLLIWKSSLSAEQTLFNIMFKMKSHVYVCGKEPYMMNKNASTQARSFIFYERRSHA